MKSKKLLLTGIITTALVAGGILYAADHKDTPSLTGQPTDITDMYVFKSPADPSNLVFVVNTHGLLSPTETVTTTFDANTLMEINIDTNGDHVEDKVIQAIYDASSNKVNIYGPVTPSETGTRSKLEGDITASAVVTAYGAGSPTIGTSASGIKVFAGPRDDPFFFDLTQYKAIIAGTASGFNNPGTDTFAGTNVMSVVIEIPKSLFGTSATTIDTWLETKKKV